MIYDHLQNIEMNSSDCLGACLACSGVFKVETFFSCIAQRLSAVSLANFPALQTEFVVVHEEDTRIGFIRKVTAAPSSTRDYSQTDLAHTVRHLFALV